MQFIVKLSLFLALILPQIANADNAPDPIKQNFKQSYLIGAAEFKVLFLKVYRISLWSEEPEFSYDKKFAIHLLYKMNLTRKELIQRSMDELEKLHPLTNDEEQNYRKQLRSVFCSVKKGDQKVAIFLPHDGFKMFYNNKFIGKISDPKLARFFSDIWLDEKGSYPKVTKAILGKT